MAQEMNKGTEKFLKGALMALLVAFSSAAVIFSLVVILTDFGKTFDVKPEQSQAMFRIFAERYLDEVSPVKARSGASWRVTDIQFTGKNYAVVTATDGTNESQVEFVYLIEGKNVRALRINDVSGKNQQDAHLALLRFLTALRDGDFENAASLYGGALAPLVPYGNGTAALPALLASYCKTVSPTKACPGFTITNPVYDRLQNQYQFTVTYVDQQNVPITFKNGATQFTAIVKMRGPQEFQILTLPFG